MSSVKKAQVSGRTSCIRTRAALLVGSLLLLGSLCAARPLVNPATSGQLSLSKRGFIGPLKAVESSHSIQEVGEAGAVSKNSKTTHFVAPKVGGPHGEPPPNKNLEKDAKELSGGGPFRDRKLTGEEPHDAGLSEASRHHQPDKLQLKGEPPQTFPGGKSLKTASEEAPTLPASADPQARIWRENVDNTDQVRSGFLPERTPRDLGGN
ncbi:putative signal peptide protein [Puccinia sorghi]|uniref:Putative signal peptide protein n=1 Tax=Puccinia sorghi TaxID=27349 RepID=A0A0L6VTW2_9BASI|nr:putative signal peptide protein [Puccinia sorghi]